MSLQLTWPCAALENSDLASRTTMRVGGRVEVLLEPADPKELREAVAATRERGLELRMLGGGANLIIGDGLLPGVVIRTDRMRRVFRPNESDSKEEDALGLVDGIEPSARVAFDRESDPRLVVWCGASMPGLARTAKQLGWTGLEGLVGVPGSIGGGLAMNAGGRWGELWEVVERVLLIDENGELVEKTRAECSPSYRNGDLGNAIAVSAVLQLTVDTVPAVTERSKQFLIEKNKVQPVSENSAGCIFKNPDPEKSNGLSAGQLVDQAGCKGRTIGDAIVSPLHGNFIVNRGNASATDVLALIDEVRQIVADHSGVQLEIEVKRWIPGQKVES